MNDQGKIWKSILTAFAIGGVGFLLAVLVLHPIFSGKYILPQNLHLGSFKIQFYGVILGLAALAAYWFTLKRKVTYKIESEDADTIFFLVLIFGFVGARIYHVISEFPYYVHNLAQTFAIWNGGLSIFGAGLGGVLGLFIYTKIVKKYSLMQLLDWLTPGVLIGQIIGRFGNFINYELYGKPTNLPWKMFVPKPFRLPGYETYSFFHPLFLYEAAGSVVILLLILRLNKRTGQLFLGWLFLYNLMRIFLEFLRVGSIVYSGIHINAIVAFVFMVTAAIIYYVQSHSSNS